jgi:signal transduction histidine kinase
MKITDNGHGFSISRQQTQGMGLKNMKARARKLGARIAIASAPGKGTHVTVSIPRD